MKIVVEFVDKQNANKRVLISLEEEIWNELSDDFFSKRAAAVGRIVEYGGEHGGELTAHYDHCIMGSVGEFGGNAWQKRTFKFFELEAVKVSKSDFRDGFKPVYNIEGLPGLFSAKEKGVSHD